MQKRKEKVIYLLRATSRRQSGLFVHQITLKTYRMPESYHSLKSMNILKNLKLTQRKKIQEKAAAPHFTIKQHVDLSSISLHTTVIVQIIMFG